MVEEQVVEARVVEIREGKVLSGVAGTWYRTVTKDPHPARPRIQSNPARPSAMMYCPSCGRLGSLHDHEIGGDGTVKPEARCPWGLAEPRPCAFRGVVKLAGW